MMVQKHDRRYLVMYLPIILFSIFFFIFGYIGTMLLLFGPEVVREIYTFYAGVELVKLTSEQNQKLMVLLHFSPLLMILGYSIVVLIKKNNFHDVVEKKNILMKPLAFYIGFFLSSLMAFFSIYRAGGFDRVSYWFNHDYWISARWALFEKLSFFEFVNIYTILPLTTAGLTFYFFNQRKLLKAIPAFLLGLILSLLTYQKKQMLVFIFFTLSPILFLYINKVKLRSVIWLGVATFLLYVAVVLVPMIGYQISDPDALKIKREDQIGRFLPGMEVTDDERGSISEFDRYKLAAITRLVYITNSILFRTSPPSIYYIVTYPDLHPYYGLDLPLDGKVADDNLEVWKVMWPSTPGGSVMASFQFSYYAQVGVWGTLILSFLMGGFLGYVWVLIQKIRSFPLEYALAASVTFVFAIFLSAESFKNAFLSSYGMIWGYLLVLFFLLVKRVRLLVRR